MKYFAFEAEEHGKPKMRAYARDAAEQHSKITLLCYYYINTSNLAKHIKSRHADIFTGFPEVVVTSPFITTDSLN